MLWLTGGPGCSALSGLLYEIGPFTIDYANSTLVKTELKINPYSWTKAANIIFLDQPAGSGFSYAKTPEASITNDTLATMHAYHFLRKVNNNFLSVGNANREASVFNFSTGRLISKIVIDSEITALDYDHTG